MLTCQGQLLLLNRSVIKGLHIQLRRLKGPRGEIHLQIRGQRSPLRAELLELCVSRMGLSGLLQIDNANGIGRWRRHCFFPAIGPEKPGPEQDESNRCQSSRNGLPAPTVYGPSFLILFRTLCCRHADPSFQQSTEHNEWLGTFHLLYSSDRLTYFESFFTTSCVMSWPP